MNYRELQALQQELSSQGFTVLAFPCNQFGKQEPGSNKQIKEFATLSYSATFPLFSKINVNGADANPLWKFLKASITGTFGQSIKWNFTKFLVNGDGKPIQRYGPMKDPSSIRPDILSLLKIK